MNVNKRVLQNKNIFRFEDTFLTLTVDIRESNTLTAKAVPQAKG